MDTQATKHSKPLEVDPWSAYTTPPVRNDRRRTVVWSVMAAVAVLLLAVATGTAIALVTQSPTSAGTGTETDKDKNKDEGKGEGEGDEPTADEVLLSRLPESVSDCKPVEAPSHGIAEVTCEKFEGATTELSGTFWLFTDQKSMDAAYKHMLSTWVEDSLGDDLNDCAYSANEAVWSYEEDDPEAGRAACYTYVAENGSMIPVITWTENETLVIADVADVETDDPAPLFAWWSE